MRFSWLPYAIGAFVLFGCASSPKIPIGNSVHDFVRNISGQEYYFELTDKSLTNPLLAEEVKGLPDSLFGYSGLRIALSPLGAYCRQAGGRVIIESKVEVNQRMVPSIASCRANDSKLWGVGLSYKNVHVFGGYVFLTIQGETKSAAQLAEEDARKEEERVRLAEKSAEQAKINAKLFEHQRIREEEDRKRRDEARRKFQQALKVGDKVKWHVPDSSLRATGYGMVINVTGDLAYVQFDNLRIAGNNMRFVPRNELEPWAGESFGRHFDLN